MISRCVALRELVMWNFTNSKQRWFTTKKKVQTNLYIKNIFASGNILEKYIRKPPEFIDITVECMNQGISFLS